MSGPSSHRGNTNRLTRASGLAAIACSCSASARHADAARCGGQKANMVGSGGDNVLKSDKHGVQVIVGGAGTT